MKTGFHSNIKNNNGVIKVKLKEFEVTLESGKQTIYALSEEQAVILAQANAIQRLQNYRLIKVIQTA